LQTSQNVVVGAQGKLTLHFSAVTNEDKLIYVTRFRHSRSFNPSTNMTLAPLYHVMRFECDENPGILGFAVSGLDQISEKIRAFVGTRTGNERKFYFVSSDVAQCYDRIDQKRLFEIASRLFTQESYLVSKSTIISRGSRVRVSLSLLIDLRSLHLVVLSVS